MFHPNWFQEILTKSSKKREIALAYKQALIITMHNSRNKQMSYNQRVISMFSCLSASFTLGQPREKYTFWSKIYFKNWKENEMKY